MGLNGEDRLRKGWKPRQIVLRAGRREGGKLRQSEEQVVL